MAIIGFVAQFYSMFALLCNSAALPYSKMEGSDIRISSNKGHKVLYEVSMGILMNN